MASAAGDAARRRAARPIVAALALLAGCLAVAVMGTGAASVALAAVGSDTATGELRVNLAGRQRMLTERTSAEVLAATIAGSSAERAAHRAAAQRSAALLHDTERVLGDGGDVLDLRGRPTSQVLPVAPAHLRTLRLALAESVASYTAAADELLLVTIRSDDRRVAGFLARRTSLVAALDAATTAEQAQAAQTSWVTRKVAAGAVGLLAGCLAGALVLAVRRRERSGQRRAGEANDVRLRALLTGSREATLLLGRDSTIRYATPAAGSLGLPPEAVVGRALVDLVAARDRSRVADAVMSGTLDEVEVDLAGGAIVSLTLTDLTDDPTVDGLVAHVRDISERRRVERLRFRRDATADLMRSVASAANTSSSVQEALQIVLDEVCQHFEWKIGHALVCDPGTGELRSARLWSHSAHAERFAEFRRTSNAMTWTPGVGLPGRVLTSGEPLWVADVTQDHNFPRAPYAVRAGLHAAAAFPLMLDNRVIAVLEFFDTEVLNADEDVLELMRNIGHHLGRVAEREQTASVLRHQAHTDHVTGLRNRAAFQAALAEMQAAGGPLTVLCVDLDDFKDVNDMLGHSKGDDLLRHVAAALQATSRDTDVVARIGGDEFAILTTCPPAAADRLADRVLESLVRDVPLGEGSVQVRASLGISTAHPDGGDLLVEADLALYAAKARGKSCWVRFDETLAQELQTRTQLDERLREALRENDFEVHYQPVVDAVTGAVVSAEALLRWPGSGMGPQDFVPRLEMTGLIVPVGRWVLETACRQAAAWAAAGHRRSVAVNVSPRQIATAGFEHEVAEVLATAGLPASLLVLEVTETAADGLAVDVLSRIRELGVGIAIDDFGTGYSSMARLRTMPTDTIKIDRSFVGELGDTGTSQALVRSMVELAHALSLRVVAEGVETTGQRDALQAMHCDLLQGYLYSRPVPAHELDGQPEPAGRGAQEVSGSVLA